MTDRKSADYGMASYLAADLTRYCAMAFAADGIAWPRSEARRSLRGAAENLQHAVIDLSDPDTARHELRKLAEQFGLRCIEAQDTAGTLVDARADAVRAVEEMALDGWHVALIEARRDGAEYVVAVTYSRDSQ